MSKVGIKAIIAAASIMLLASIVALVFVFIPRVDSSMDYFDHKILDDLVDNNAMAPEIPSDGSVKRVSVNSNITELTAVANNGYTFSHWQIYPSNGNNPNMKMSGDATIRVDSLKANSFLPIFVSNSNVIQITSLNDSKLTTNIKNNTTAGKIFVLTQDCNLNTNFIPLGKFCGTFNGNGHKINSLNISNTAAGNYSGIFSELDNAVVKNLIVASGNISTNFINVGTFAGIVKNSLLSRCVSNISVKGTNASAIVGGIAGLSSGEKSMFYKCEFDGSIAGKIRDGILGNNSNSSLLFHNKNKAAMK